MAPLSDSLPAHYMPGDIFVTPSTIAKSYDTFSTLYYSKVVDVQDGIVWAIELDNPNNGPYGRYI